MALLARIHTSRGKSRVLGQERVNIGRGLSCTCGIRTPGGRSTDAGVSEKSLAPCNSSITGRGWARGRTRVGSRWLVHSSQERVTGERGWQIRC